MGTSKGIAYDPNDIARTTIKQTTLENDYSANVQNMTRGNVVYDPDDVARTTIKETNIHNTHAGIFSSNAPSRGFVYDPDEVARTTTKQTTLENNYEGAIQTSYPKGVAYDPDDVTRTTLRETTMAENSIGIASQNRGDGYLVNDVQAPETIRQHNSVEYFGDSQGPQMGGYEVTDVVPNNTNRQFTSDTEYFGSAENNNKKPPSYEDIYNSTIKAVRGMTDQGYTPNPGGVNELIDSSNIKMTTHRIGDIQNRYINERGVTTNLVYNSIPQMNQSNLSQIKEIVPNEPLANRINPDILSARNSNPYAIPLNSWA